MQESREDEKFEQLVRRIEPQSKLLRRWQPTGGVSAQVTALEVERTNGQTHRMIVRRHGARNLGQNPHVAADEYQLLRILQFAGVAAPAPYFLDQSGEIFSSPILVIEYIEGETEFAPSSLADLIRQLAAVLVKIHRINCSHHALSFLPKQTKGFGKQPAHLDESLEEGRIREALESTWPLAKLNEPVLLHGDYWPGNILWKDGRLVAVIDWEDAKVGDPLADVANCRLELLWAFGIDAACHFTHDYAAMTTIDFTNLAYWDLCAALRPASKMAEWGLDEITEQAMREGHRLFVAQAMEKLSGQSG